MTTAERLRKGAKKYYKEDKINTSENNSVSTADRLRQGAQKYKTPEKRDVGSPYKNTVEMPNTTQNTTQKAMPKVTPISPKQPIMKSPSDFSGQASRTVTPTITSEGNSFGDKVKTVANINKDTVLKINEEHKQKNISKKSADTDRFNREMAEKFATVDNDTLTLFDEYRSASDESEGQGWASIASAFSGQLGATPRSGETKKTKAYQALVDKGYTDKEIEQMSRYRSSVINAERAKAENAAVKMSAQNHPWLSSAATVGVNLPGTMLSAVEYAKAKITDTPVDLNSPYIQPTNYVQNTRQQVQDDHNVMVGNKDVFDFAYSVAMAGADSLLASAVSPSLGIKQVAGKGVGTWLKNQAIKGVNGIAGGALIGSQAAANAAVDLSRRGASTDSAIAGGIAAGVFETLFESYSIGNFKGLSEVAPETIKDLTLNIAKSTAVNFSEEALTEIANISYDTIANGDISNYAINIENYIKSGYTETEAKQRVAEDLAKQIIEAGASGALMGAGFGAVGSGVGYSRGAAYNYVSGKQIQNSGNVGNLVDDVQSLNGNDKLRALAQKVAKANSVNVGEAVSGNIENASPPATEPKSRLAAARDAYNVGKLQRMAINHALDKDSVDTAVKIANASQSAAAKSEVTAPIGVTKSGKRVEIDGIETAENGKMTVKTSEGETIDYADVKFPSEAASTIYDVASQFGTQGAKALIANFDGGNVEEYTRAFKSYYNLGATGLSLEKIRRIDSFEYDSFSVAAQQAAVNAGAKERVFKPGVTDTTDGKKAAAQRLQLNIIDKYAKEKGIAVITTVGSNVNGTQFRGTNRIVLDLDETDSPLLVTFSHELYHNAKENADSTDLDNLIKNALVKKGVWEDAVAHEMSKDSSLTREGAEEEVIARSMFDAIGENEIREICTKNKPLAQKVKKALDNLIKWLNDTIDTLAKTDAAKREMRALSGDLELLKQKRELFNDLLNQAVKNFKDSAAEVSGEKVNGTDDVKKSTQDSDSMGNGYDGYSMSVNARRAYEDGEKPLSKWTKADIIQAVENIDMAKADIIRKVNIKFLREYLLSESSWHHTSSYYNKTTFYGIDEKAVANLTADTIKRWVGIIPAADTTTKYRGNIEYLEWSGTRNYPKSTKKVLTNVNIEEKGSFYVVTDDNGKELLRKKIGSNGTYVTNAEKQTAEHNRQAEQKRELFNDLLNRASESFKDSIADDSGDKVNKHSSKDVDTTKRINEIRSEINAAQDKLVQIRKQQDEEKETDTYKAFMSVIGKGLISEIEKPLRDFAQWENDNGYAQVEKQRQEITGKLKDLYSEYQSILDKQREEALDGIKDFSNETISKYVAKAVLKYGTTSRYDYAGYLTTTGSMLDFSSGQGQRVNDHREIANVLDFLPAEHGYSDGMIAFMNMGNIRMQSYGIDITKAPNAKQTTVLSRFFSSLNGEVTVDFSRENGDSNGSVEYPKGTSNTRILRDIDNYFKTGAVPELSTTEMFHEKYSTRDTEYLELAKDPEKNKDKLQAMVDEAAKAAGYTVKAYHGTKKEFTVFDIDKAKSLAALGQGHYFAEDASVTEKYGDKIVSAYLKVENPLTVSGVRPNSVLYSLRNATKGTVDVNTVLSDGRYASGVNTKKMTDFIKSIGYDGIYESTHKYYVVYNSNQIKSSDPITYDDSGDIIPLSERFNSNDDDIRYSKRDSQGRELSANQQEFFKDSKVRDAEGNLAVGWHGSYADFSVFDKNRAGKGTDQFGAGFYFGTTKEVAEAYGSILYQSYLNIKKPLVIKNTRDGGNLFDVMLTQRQAYEVVKRHPLIKDSEDSPLGDFYEEYWDGGAEDWMVRDLATRYQSVGLLDSDLFKNYPNELHEAIRSVAGYDGICVDFDDSDSQFYIAWFPEQIKSTDNLNPTDNDDIRYSTRDVPKETLGFLNEQLENGDVVEVYRAMQTVEIDGEEVLVPPMAGKVKVGGEWVWQNPSRLNEWEQSTEITDFDAAVSNGILTKTEKDGRVVGYKFNLKKGQKGTTDVAAAYNPYIHTSLSPLNDQFTSAYKRPNLRIVKGYVPMSELTSGYQANFAKDTVGKTRWHSGVVAGKMPETREVILSRYFMPIEVLDDKVTAKLIKQQMQGRDIVVPYNVVSPSLRQALEDVGVSIGEGEGLANLPPKDSVNLSLPDHGKISDDYKAVMSENEHLQKMVETLKQEFKLTQGHRVQRKSVEKVARKMLKEYSSKYGLDDFTDKLHALYDYVANNSNEISWDMVIGQMSELAREVIEESTTLDDTFFDESTEIRKMLKQPIYLSDSIRKEAAYYYGTYENYRRKMFGKVNFVNNPNARTLDEVWQEMSSYYPYLFEEQANSSDMPIRLVEVLDIISPRYVNPFGMDMDAAAYDMALQLYDAYFDIPEIRTYADKQATKMKLLRSKYAQRLESVRTSEKAKYTERLANEKKSIKGKLSANKAKALAEQKALYDGRIKRMREQRSDTDERRTLRRNIIRTVKRLNTLLVNPTDQKHIPEGFKKSVLTFCEMFTDDTSVFDKEKLERLSVSYSQLREGGKLSDSSLSSLYDEDIGSMLDELSSIKSGRRLSEIPAGELRTARDIANHLSHMVKMENKLFTEGKSETITELGFQALSDINSTKEKARFSNSLKTGMLKPVYFFEQLGSQSFQTLYQSLVEGQNKNAKIYSDTKAFRIELDEKYNRKQWLESTITFDSRNTGKKITLTLGEALSVYATAKRAQGAEHITVGGMVLERDAKRKMTVMSKKANKEAIKELKKRGVNIKSETTPLSIKDIQEISGKLTAEQKKYADEFVNYLSEDMARLGNETSMALYGYRKFGEKYYFPIKSAKGFLYTKPAVTGDLRIKNTGMTKSLIPKANNPVVISDFTEVCLQHCEEMATYHSFAAVIEDFTRVYNYKTPVDTNGTPSTSVKTEMLNTYGEKATDYIEHLLTDINGGVTTQAGTDGINKLISKAKKSAVFASLSVAIQQPSAIGRALLYVDPKHFTKTTFEKRDYEELKKWAPVAIIKEMGYFDTSVGMQAVQWMGAQEYEGFKEKGLALFIDSDYRNEVLSKLPSWMDAITWAHIWNAVKAETADTHKNLTPGSDEFLKTAGERFTYVIDRTQVYDSVLSRSQLMRSKDTGVKMLTAFMAEPTVNYNMLASASLQAKDGGVKGKRFAARALGAYTVSLVFNSMLKSIIAAGRDDDENETYLEKYLAKFVESLVTDPFEMVVYVKDIFNMLRGYDVERIDAKIFSEAIDAVTAVVDSDKSVTDKLQAVIGAIGTFTGIPAKNIWRDTEMIIRNAASVFDGGNDKTSLYGIRAAIEAEFGDKQTNVDKVEDYGKFVNKGKSSEASKLLSEMVDAKVAAGKDDNEAKSSIQSSFTAYYKDLYQSAYNNGDSAEMTRIATILQSTRLYGRGKAKPLSETLADWRKSAKE